MAKNTVLKIDEETKRELVKLQGRLQAENGKKISMSKVVDYLIETLNYAKNH